MAQARIDSKAQDGAVTALLAVAGFFLCLNAGHIGFDLGPDVFFYGGYAASQGAVPFADFFSSYGAPLFLLQGLVVRLFGPSWETYLLHTALWNGLFAAMSFQFLRLLELDRFSSGIYALGSALLFYPSIGFLHPDKIAYPFLLAALLLQLLALNQENARTVFALYLGAALLALLALFCKLNPTALFPLALLVPFLILPKEAKLPALLGVGAALLVLAAGLGLAESLVSGFVRDAFYYAFLLPLGVGAERLQAGLSLAKLGTYASYPTLYLMMAGAVGAIVATLAQPARLKALLLPLGLGLALMVVAIFHVTHIAQPMPSQLTLVLLALGCFHTAISRGLDTKSRLVLASLLLTFTLLGLSEYHRQHVKFRVMLFDNAGTQSPREPGSLGVWGLEKVAFVPSPAIPRGLETDFPASVDILKELRGNLFLYGLPAQYYVFADKAPVLPTWSTGFPGHTTPLWGSDAEKRLAEQLLANLIRHDVRIVVAPKTQKGLDKLAVCGWQESGPLLIGQICAKPDAALALALLRLE